MGVNAFARSNKGISITKEGEELLSYARNLLEQAAIMKERFCTDTNRKPKFSISCQHYSFAVNAFVEVVKKYDANEYNFIIRETQTGEIIEGVANGKSELGILYLNKNNEDVLRKMLKKNEIIFEEMFEVSPHVFINRDHPLAANDIVTLDELRPYPYLVYEQGERNSFYFSEEFLSVLDMPKSIQVRDRATLFNLAVGLNGFTVSSGIIDKNINGENIIARPLKMDCSMHIGLIKKKNVMLSRYANTYIEILKRYSAIV